MSLDRTATWITYGVCLALLAGCGSEESTEDATDDGERGLHQATEQKGVTVSFFTDDVDGWFERAAARPGFELRTPEVTGESGRVRVFVAYDPEGYFLEWDTFVEVEENHVLLQLLKENR